MADAAGNYVFGFRTYTTALFSSLTVVYERSEDHITRYIMGGTGAFIRQCRRSTY